MAIDFQEVAPTVLSPSHMKARAAALISSKGEVVEMWRHKPEMDHENLQRSFDLREPSGAPHLWVEMGPTGAVL